MKASDKYIKGTEYGRTYTAASGAVCPVRDSFTAILERVAYPKKTVEEKFDLVMEAARLMLESGESVQKAVEFANLMWGDYSDIENILPVYGLEIPVRITEEMLLG